METQAKEKAYSKLGFDKEEATQIVDALNTLLCNYSVVYQKIRNFHWNVVGGDFFDVHEKLEAEYLHAAETIDSVAERIRILGFKPMSTLAAYLEHADIEESEGDLSSNEMIKAVIADYELLLSFMVDVADLAIDFGDIGTETLMRHLIVRTEKRHWMFSAFAKK